MERMVWQKYSEEDLIVFGINVDESPAVVEDFIKRYRLTFPVLLGTSGLKDLYNIAGSHVSPYPRDIIIGKNGLIAYASDEFDPETIILIIDDQLGLTPVKDNPPVSQPIEFQLGFCFPNPVSISNHLTGSDGVHIEYNMAGSHDVSLQVFDVRGRHIRTLFSALQLSGHYSRSWNGRDVNNHLVPTGVYFIRLSTGLQQQIQKVVVVR